AGAIWSVCPLLVGSGAIAIGCQDGTARMLQMSADARTMEYVGVLDRAPSGKVVCMSFCQTKKWLAVGMDNDFVRIVDIDRKTSIGQYHTDSIPTALEWSCSGDSLFVGLKSGKLLIVDPNTCQPLSEMTLHIATIRSIVSCGNLDVFVAGVDHRTLHLTRT